MIEPARACTWTRARGAGSGISIHHVALFEAIKKHDIGYHANFHSVHPTVSEYEANLGWLDGVAEFVRREGGGAEDV